MTVSPDAPTPDAKTSFMWTCPQGHQPFLTYKTMQLRADLARSTVFGFCGWCGKDYPLPPDVQANVRRMFFSEDGP
jgi:hypothetical protein